MLRFETMEKIIQNIARQSYFRQQNQGENLPLSTTSCLHSSILSLASEFTLVECQLAHFVILRVQYFTSNIPLHCHKWNTKISCIWQFSVLLGLLDTVLFFLPPLTNSNPVYQILDNALDNETQMLVFALNCHGAYFILITHLWHFYSFISKTY